MTEEEEEANAGFRILEKKMGEPVARESHNLKVVSSILTVRNFCLFIRAFETAERYL